MRYNTKLIKTIGKLIKLGEIVQKNKKILLDK